MGAINVRAGGGGGIMTAEQVRDALLSIPDNDRVFIITNPEPGEHKIYSFQRRNSTSLVEYDYDDVPE